MPLSARWPLANARTGRRPARPSAEAVRPLAGRAPVNVPAPRPPRSGRGRRRWPRQLPAAGADRPGAWRRPGARDRWRRRRRAGARAPGTLRAGVLVPWTPWGFPRPRACDEGSAQSLCSIPLRRPLRQRGPRPAAEEVVPTAVATRAPSAGPPASAPARAAVHHGGPRRPTDAPRRSPRVQSVDGGLPRPGYAHALASDSPGPRAAGAPATPDACARPPRAAGEPEGARPLGSRTVVTTCFAARSGDRPRPLATLSTKPRRPVASDARVPWPTPRIAGLVRRPDLPSRVLRRASEPGAEACGGGPISASVRTPDAIGAHHCNGGLRSSR